MKVLSISELLCLTRFELIELKRSLLRQLVLVPEGSSERRDTLATLANIRIVLARLAMMRRQGRTPSPS